jgi:ribose 5-phosphate isomerase A
MGVNIKVDQEKMKEAAAFAAVDRLVKSGMKLGLGTGSTAIHAVRRVGALLREGRLAGIRAVATSFQTEMECERLGIPLFTLNSRETGGQLDLTIDGADEVDGENRCVKGGGAALLLEKIAAYASAAWAVVVDESKLAENLGTGFPVPLEVVQEARITVTRYAESLGAEVTLRKAVRKAGPVITEHGNIILDLRFSRPVSPAALEEEFNNFPGIVESGFFTRVRPRLFIARADGAVEERA